MASVDNDQEDCQMQPLDLSCPKVRRQSDDNTTIITEGGHGDVSPPFPRPRSSSGGSDESSPSSSSTTDFRQAVLQNWPLNLAFPSALMGGPARKRFLTKYLHKDTGKLYFVKPFLIAFDSADYYANCKSFGVFSFLFIHIRIHTKSDL